MGHSRSAALAAAWLTSSRRAASLDDVGAPAARSLAARFAAQSLALTARILTGAEARWIGCAPTQAQRIYLANHASHADAVVLWSALPPQLREHTCPVAAAGYWQAGSLRRYLAEQVFGSVLVERDHVSRTNNPMDVMCRAIRQGKSLIVFPEGTRGTGGEPDEFKCGIYHLARRHPEIELVPVWIANLSRSFQKRALIPVPLLCPVTFGKPTRLAEGEDKPIFLARLRRELIAARDL